MTGFSGKYFSPRGLRIVRWCLRRWYRTKWILFERRKGVLLYLGMHKGREFDSIFNRYGKCYGFEANPDLFKLLVEKYKEFPHVKLINAAVTTVPGSVTLNISSNDGASSSLGVFEDEWPNHKSGVIEISRSVDVPGINLHQFCRSEGIEYIDDYISDIQGMDLEVLKTMRSYVDSGNIETITVETTRNERRNIYKDLPDNSEAGFNALLENNYRLVAVGFGVLEDYWFADIDPLSWEFDCKWRRRTLFDKLWLKQ
jgi:FkbM family methyltransferase